MKVQLSKWGNSAAVRLPAAVVEELGLEPGQQLDLTVEGGEARLKPVKKSSGDTLQDLVGEMKRLGPENIPPYEDWGILPSEWPQEDWSDIAPTDESD